MKGHRIFRGTIEVVDRKGLIKTMDESGAVRSGAFKERLLAALDEIASMQDCPDPVDAAADEMALDIRVPSYLAGAALFGDLPIFWRPKVTVMARLRNLKSGETVFYSEATRRMPWKEFIPAAISIRRAFSLGPQFTEDDLEPLLWGACQDAIGMLSHEAAIESR